MRRRERGLSDRTGQCGYSGGEREREDGDGRPVCVARPSAHSQPVRLWTVSLDLLSVRGHECEQTGGGAEALRIEISGSVLREAHVRLGVGTTTSETEVTAATLL